MPSFHIDLSHQYLKTEQWFTSICGRTSYQTSDPITSVFIIIFVYPCSFKPIITLRSYVTRLNQFLQIRSFRLIHLYVASSYLAIYKTKLSSAFITLKRENMLVTLRKLSLLMILDITVSSAIIVK